MKITISIAKPDIDLETGKETKCSKENLCIEVEIFTSNEELATQIMSQLDNKVNELIQTEANYCNHVKCFSCPAVEKESYYDGFSMKKDKGDVTEQRKEIVKLFNKAKKIVLNEM